MRDKKKVAQYNKEYYLKNIEYFREYSKKNKSKRAENNKEYYKRNENLLKAARILGLRASLLKRVLKPGFVLISRKELKAIVSLLKFSKQKNNEKNRKEIIASSIEVLDKFIEDVRNN